MRFNDKDAVWDDGAVTVIAGMIAHAIRTAPAGRAASLLDMRRLLRRPPAGLAEVFAEMAEAGDAFGGLARAAASVGQCQRNLRLSV